MKSREEPDLVTLRRVNLHTTQTDTCEQYHYGLSVLTAEHEASHL